MRLRGREIEIDGESAETVVPWSEVALYWPNCAEVVINKTFFISVRLQ